MPSFTQPIRDEHRGLLPQLESVKDAADSVHEIHQDKLQAKVATALEFLRGHLIPHTQAEEAALYPAVARFMGSPISTATMSVDNKMIMHGTGEIAEAASHLPNANKDQLRELQTSLYAVYAITRVHFVKEEQVYLPLLDQKLDDESAKALFQAIESAARDAHAKAAAAHA